MGRQSRQKVAGAVALLMASLPSALAAANSSIFSLPSVVTAGQPTTVQANLTTSEKEGQNVDCGGPSDCSQFEYFQLYIETDPQYNSKNAPTDPATVTWSPYCYIQGCVATNVTSFNITIPSASFPSSTGGSIAWPYSLTYALFNMSSPNETDSTSGAPGALPPVLYHPNDPSDISANIFTLRNATGSFSSYARDNGTAGIGPDLELAPCEQVPCMQECQTKWAADGKNTTALGTCVEQCIAGVPPLVCVVSNVTSSTSLGSSLMVETGRAWVSAVMAALVLCAVL